MELSLLSDFSNQDSIQTDSNFRVDGFLRYLDTWAQRARTRKNLLNLDERMLKDIGLSRGSALSEAKKPFWQE